MQQAEELDLIERAQGGNNQAFRELVETHQRFVYSVAMRFTGDIAEAEDITQEVFVKLWKNLGKYREGVKLTTWLYKIIANHCFDYLKSASKRQQLKSVDMESAQIADAASQESHLDDRELISVITVLAKQLTPKQQTIFVLRDLEGLSIDEVCEISGMSPGTMKSNLYYARVKIREDLTKYYKETAKLLPS